MSDLKFSIQHQSHNTNAICSSSINFPFVTFIMKCDMSDTALHPKRMDEGIQHQQVYIFSSLCQINQKYTALTLLQQWQLNLVLCSSYYIKQF